jgi:hypothetical protein
MKKLKIQPVLVLLITVVFTSCHYTAYTLKVHQNFNQIRSRIKTVAVVPPFLKYTDNINNEPSSQFTDSLKNIVKVSIEELLEKNGFNVQNTGKIKIDMIENKDYALLLAATKRKFTDKTYLIKDTKEPFLNIKMQPQIRDLAKRLNADYLILTRGEAIGPTNSDLPQNTAPNVLLGNRIDKSYFSLLLEIAVVDGKTTEIILYNRNIINDSRYLPLNKKSCQKLLFILLGGKLLKNR